MSRFRRYARAEYRWCIEELSAPDQLRRAAAEIDILETAVDGDREDRTEVHWGGRIVTLQDTDGLITAYHMRDGDEVSFDLVFGTDPLPDWFIDRESGWFARLDLT
jgi:hypothetical protein